MQFDMTPSTVTREQAAEIIQSSGGKFVSVEFIKRDGSVRRLCGRKGVQQYLSESGKGPAYNPADYNLVNLWEPAVARREGEGRKAYRSVPLDRLTKIKLPKGPWVDVQD